MYRQKSCRAKGWEQINCATTTTIQFFSRPGARPLHEGTTSVAMRRDAGVVRVFGSLYYVVRDGIV